MRPTPFGHLGLATDYVASWRRLASAPERIERYQERALRKLVDLAVAETPYYGRLFREVGLRPGEIRGLDSLSRIPISDKATLQGVGFEDRVRRGVRVEECIVHETSGSTGEPLATLRAPDEELRLFGRRLRALALSGVRPSSRRVQFGSKPVRNLAHRAGLYKVWNIPLSMDPDRAMGRLEELRPDFVKGPPTAIERLVDVHSDRMRALALRSIFTGAEQLSSSVRARLESACGCRVVDFYGAVESNLIAWECVRCGLYHTCDDSVIVEVLRDGIPVAPGEEGEVVVTVLGSYSMPIIRYALGDIARKPARGSSCKIRFGSIERVEGRTVDSLRFRDGETLSPYTIMDELDVIDGVRRYEVVQTHPMKVLVRYQPMRPGAENGLANEIRERSKAVLPSSVELVTQMSQIVLEPRRKRRFVTALDPDER